MEERQHECDTTPGAFNFSLSVPATIPRWIKFAARGRNVSSRFASRRAQYQRARNQSRLLLCECHWPRAMPVALAA